jgi:tRNA G18 (ribose-2'-O)-methylase SpoU
VAERRYRPADPVYGTVMVWVVSAYRTGPRVRKETLPRPCYVASRLRVPVERVDTADDPRLLPFRELRAPDAGRRDGLFVAETRGVVRELLASRRFRTHSLLLTSRALEDLADVLAGRGSLPVYVAPLPVLKAVVGFDFHRGCLGLGERGLDPGLEILDSAPRRLVVLDEVSNPDNVGGVLRVARALGAGAALLSAGSGDPLYRKTIRVSLGAALALPWARATEWEETLGRLGAAGYLRVALSTAGALDVAALGAQTSLPERVALLLGNEGGGLRPATLAAADVTVRVPMAPGIDSLNVVTACAVALDRLGGARR